MQKWLATVDLFTTRLNHRLPVCFSPVADAMSIGMDAILQPWDNVEVYAFPPFGMVHQVLLKVHKSVNCTMTLIDLFWPQQSLLDLLIEVLGLFPQRKDLLRQPHFHRLHRNLHMLCMTAWRTSRYQPYISASLRQWLSSLLIAKDILPI